MSGVVFVNPSSGKEDNTQDIRRLFDGHTIVECDPGELDKRLREAISAQPDFVAIAGGDGTIRSAADLLRGGPIPLLPIPAGTRNHFAKAVGIDTLEKAVDAITGCVRRVDLGEVNGACFVNNSAIGLYPSLVREREARQRRWPKWAANIGAAVEQMRHGQRLRVTLDGQDHVAWMAFVGNGLYGEGVLDLAERDSLDTNVLDVRIIRADARLTRTRVVFAVLAGRLARSPLVRQTKAQSVCLDVARPAVDVALDGEVRQLNPPLRYESKPEALLVLVPDGDAAPPPDGARS